MSGVPSREDYTTLTEWVDAVVNSTGVVEETLWDIVEEFKPGARLMTGSEKEVKLLKLLEYHHEKLVEAGDNPGAAPFINLYFPFEGEVDTLHQFQWGGFNAVRLNDEREKAFRKIIEEEELDIVIEDEDHITAANYEWDPEEALRVSSRVLNEVYGVGIEDLERAVHVDAETGEEVAWTEVGF